MGKLIDIDGVKGFFNALRIIMKKEDEESLRIGENAIIDLLNKVPEADAKLFEHGYWVEIEIAKTFNTETFEFDLGEGIKCSKCAETYVDTVKRYNYCPNCGAIMDGEEKTYEEEEIDE